MSHLDEGTLHALLDGELTGAERREVDAHLGACAACRAALEEAKALFTEADALVAKVELPPSSTTSTPPLAGGSPRRAFPWQRVGLAATVLLAVGLGLLARWERPGIDRVAETTLAKMPDSPAAAGPTAAPEADAARSATPAADAVAPKEEQEKQVPPPEILPERALRNETAPSANQPAAPGQLAAKPAPAAPAAGEATGGLGAATDKVAEPVTALQGGASPSRSDAGSAERRDAAPVAGSPPVLATGETRSMVPDARLKWERVIQYRTVALEEAVRILGGSIRLVDGLTPVRVLAGRDAPASVRVVYDDPPGRELWLDQERPPVGQDAQSIPGQRPTALLPGDTLVSPAAGGARSLRWVDQSGFRLGLTGYLPADSLRAIARRVQ